MGDTLPSYGEATTRDHWSIIASFVRSADLCSAALVCRKWNTIFSPLLWGNPASHFGRQNDAVYVALVRFKRTLLWVRSSTREQTHTLHFPPAQAEIYDGPRSEWLRDILQRLPNLQSLVVSHLPFFDHGALSSLARLSQADALRGLTHTTYNLRLLDASYCNNITPHALAGALKLFPALVYLDLSGTSSARLPIVLSSLAYVPALQILKLQKLLLQDEDLAILLGAVGRNLRSLDLRWNRITDRGVRNLIQDGIRFSNERNGSTTPRLPHTKLQQIFDSQLQDDFIRTQLTRGFVTSLGIESTAGQGITHLYLSHNIITAGAASGLLRCSQLRVLDLGDTETETIAKVDPRYELPPYKLALPPAETLTPVIEDHAERLTYLRVNHAVVTRPVLLKDAKALEMEDTSGNVLPRDTSELEAHERTVYEMHEDHRNEMEGSTPIYAELEGSPVPCPSPHERDASPVIQVRDSDQEDGQNTEPESELSPLDCPTLDCSGGLFSPISPLSPLHPKPLRLRTSGAALLSIPASSTPPSTSVPGLEVDERVQDANLPQVVQHRRTYSGVLSEHEARTRYRQAQTHALLPGTLGNLRTLVLTDVPLKSTTPETAEHIIEFIQGCAEEERWAEEQASVGYQLPPGPDRRSAERQYARTLFPFRKLVLEMAPEQKEVGSPGSWIRPSAQSQMLSSTLDPDCETYLNAAKDDFSFFGSAECGQPDTEGLAPIPTALFREKMMISADDSEGILAPYGMSTDFQQPMYDVLAQVSKFRKARKAEYDAAMAKGSHGHVDGYWSGLIEVVRPGRG